MTLKQTLFLFTLLLGLGLTALFANAATASIQMNQDENVRIGLVYSSKVADRVVIGSDKGLELGYGAKGDTATRLFDYSGSMPISVMRNVYYEKKATEVKIISDNGIKYENWHLKISATISTYNEGVNLVNTYKSRGLDSFLYYDGKWQILTGIYNASEAANYDIKDLIKLYPDLIFTALKPGEKSIMVMDSHNEPIFVFNSSGFELSLVPKLDGILKMNNDSKKQYRGRFSVYRVTGGSLKLVNVVSAQEYLYGVVPAEIGGNSPLEAAKSQAVAARNYTYNNIDKHSSEGFDLCDTTECQVYGGKSYEYPNSNKAVDETKGKLLKYNGKNAEVFYFSSTGGVYTEDVENVWGFTIPYLKSVDSKYESGKTYHAVWDRSLTRAEIKTFLANKKVDVGDILDITVNKRSQAGRVLELSVLGTKGQKIFTKEGARTVFKLDSQYYSLSTDADLTIIGKDNKVKTTLAGKKILTASGIKVFGSEQKTITIVGKDKTVKKNIQGEKYLISGKGWGHAVGLSQDGAIGMAAAGIGYEEILTHYFPGTKVE